MIAKEKFLNNSLSYLYKQIRKIYLNSNIYNRKISRVFDGGLNYVPNLSLLNCIIKSKERNFRIEDFSLEDVWNKIDLNDKDFKKIHSFYWLFTINLKSSKKVTQNIISNWIGNYESYSPKSWETDTLAKRIISWIANSQITYENATENYKILFSRNIKKQVNHLINEIDNSSTLNDKMLGCAAIILASLSFNGQTKYLDFGLNLLKKIINSSFELDGFPKSRSPRQLLFYMKYLIFIRELLRDSQNEIPEHLNEIIYYLGKCYAFFFKENEKKFLFNGNQEINNRDFQNFLKIHDYKFKNNSNNLGGYAILSHKKNCLAMDVGSSPEKKNSSEYQSGALSFEFFYDNEKLITNCGYYQDFKHKLNVISKSTASHSTISIDDSSSCSFSKNPNGQNYLKTNLKIFDKKIEDDQDKWHISAKHDGYQKKYGLNIQRDLTFFKNEKKLVGTDKIISKRGFQNLEYEIRFHLMPGTNAIKTQDQKSILIQLKKSGWKFTCDKEIFDIEKGLYFGRKNSFSENLNIFINGFISNEEEEINWSIEKI